MPFRPFSLGLEEVIVVEHALESPHGVFPALQGNNILGIDVVSDEGSKNRGLGLVDAASRIRPLEHLAHSVLVDANTGVSTIRLKHENALEKLCEPYRVLASNTQDFLDFLSRARRGHSLYPEVNKRASLPRDENLDLRTGPVY